MAKKTLQDLGKRERQIVEAVYRLGEASVSDVLKSITDAPTYSTVRAMLGLLVEKGVLRMRREGKRCLYRPSTPRDVAAKSAFSTLLSTFFPEQPTEAFAALLDLSGKLDDSELDRMKKLIEHARKENR
jgi:BlaI family transcriptional regulator, penicillinase repressor